MKAAEFDRQWRKAKEEIRLMRETGLELVAASVKAEALVDGIYEGVTGKEAPDLAEVAA